MTRELQAVIAAAEDLAWRPTSNLARGDRYNERKASHERLLAALAAWSGHLSANASDELRFLVKAIRRVAACSWCNRMGLAYYERREAVWQLRGCLDVFLGSGTTALAAEMEGFAWIGIELEPESIAIAQARLPGTQRGLGLA